MTKSSQKDSSAEGRKPLSFDNFLDAFGRVCQQLESLGIHSLDELSERLRHIKRQQKPYHDPRIDWARDKFGRYSQ